MFGRRSLMVVKVIVLFLGSFTVFSYFCARFHLGSRITIFRILFNFGYSWKILNSRRDLPK
jgi:hypothetical protein